MKEHENIQNTESTESTESTERYRVRSKHLVTAYRQTILGQSGI